MDRQVGITGNDGKKRHDAAIDERRALMATMARAPGAVLAELWSKAELSCDSEDVRAPETGLVTVRGRMGGGGAPFNLGEATVTRASVRLASGEIGHSYALGRDGAKARLAATIDALWQRVGMRDAVRCRILKPLRERIEAETDVKRAETAATKVDFFTLVRGED